MKILLIAPAFPPFPASGSRRALDVARAMHEAGHDVHVLTQRLAEDSSRYRVSEPGFEVEVVRSLPTVLDVYRSMKEHLLRAEESTGTYSQPAHAQPGEPGEERHNDDEGNPFWKRIALSFLTLPDVEGGFVTPAVLRGLQAALRGSDLIYTTAPPHSTHLVGLTLQTLTGLPWIAEFRDPWIVQGVPYRSPARRTGPADAIESWLEGACVRRADAVVTVTRSLLELYRSRENKRAPRRSVLIRNGIPNSGVAGSHRTEPARVSSEGMRIVHPGRIYGHRDPVPLFEALAAIRREGELPSEALAVEFFGEEGHYYRGVTKNLGLGDVVKFHGWIPYREAQARLQGADICLLLAQGQPLQVPNKLYEYLTSGKRILAFVDSEGESAEMLRRVGGHYLVTDLDSPAQVAKIIKAALIGERPPSGAGEADHREELLESWTTESQMRKLVRLVEALGSGREGG